MTISSAALRLWVVAICIAISCGCTDRTSTRGPDVPPTESEIPRFPWPPPQYSAFATVPRLLVAPGGQTTLRSVANRLEHAFDAAGYGERSFYWIPGGFALVSRIERIRVDASPMGGPERWSVSMQKPRVASFDQYIRALFNAPPGYYRVIVFVVTDKAFSATRQEPTAQEATDWLTAGMLELPAQIGSQPYTSDHYTSALIYEFERNPDAQQAMQKRPSDILGRTHLEKAGLWKALETP